MNDLINLPEATCRSEQYTKGLIDLINHISSKIEIRNMVEIGSYQGESTKIFAENLKNVETLYAVDPWSNGYDKLDVCSEKYDMSIVENNFNIRTDKFKFIIKKKMTSSEFVKELEDASLDFVYIDGLHSYEACKNDIENYLPKIKPGCYIGGHDYLYRCFPGVVSAVNEKFGEPDLTFDDTSWLVKLK